MLYDLRIAGGPVFEQYMRGALLLALDNEIPGATLMDIPLLFEDKDYRMWLLEHCRNSHVVKFWRNQAERTMGEYSLANMAPYITSKLNQFTTNALLRPIIGQSRSTIDFREVIDSRKVLLVNLSKGRVGELDSRLLGMLILGKIFKAAISRVEIDADRRIPFYLYIDEAGNFVTDTVAYLLSESRKFGLSLTLANQNLSQLESHYGRQSILDSVLTNAGNFLLFRTGISDAGRVEALVHPELKAEDLQELADYHASARLFLESRLCRPFVLRTLPYRSNMGGHAKLIQRVSQAKYTKLIAEIDEQLASRATAIENRNRESEI
jgi:hypothetical protein